MTDAFVGHPDGTVDAPVEDYPDTGSYTMSTDEFAAADTQRAWSLAEPDPDEPPHHDWVRVIKMASGIAAVALGVIVTVAVLLNPPSHAAKDTTITETAMPASQLPAISSEDPPPSPFVMPTVMAQHETKDGDFLHRLNVAGYDASGDPEHMVYFAHLMCSDLALGYTVLQVAIAENRDYPIGIGVSGYEQQIEIAASVYCPDLS